MAITDISKPDPLFEKQQQFNAAMQRYADSRGYQLSGFMVSLSNIILQIWLLSRVRLYAVSTMEVVLLLVIAWLLTDFVNGLVHLYMDNNDRYTGMFGPLVANFHLHHKKPLYAKRSLTLVYFMETGSKVWLVPCLAVPALVEVTTGMPPLLFHLLVYCGILSSIAEVSHYLCHTSTASTAAFLGNCCILLGKRHHAIHHMQDNRNYAFLNGLTDPLINVIARYVGHGYKEHTDRHYESYTLEGEGRQEAAG